MTFKAGAGVQQVLVAAGPERFFVPQLPDSGSSAPLVFPRPAPSGGEYQSLRLTPWAVSAAPCRIGAPRTTTAWKWCLIWGCLLFPAGSGWPYR